jgi:hypothetical protein
MGVLFVYMSDVLFQWVKRIEILYFTQGTDFRENNFELEIRYPGFESL